MGGAQVALPVAPEHVLEDRHLVGDRVAVDRNAHRALLAQDGRHVRVEDRVVDGVAAPEHDHRDEGALGTEREGALAELQAALVEARLRLQAGLVGEAPAVVVARYPPAALDELVRLEVAGASVDERGHQLGFELLAQVPAQHVRAGLHDGADHRVLFATHAGYLAQHRQKDEVGLAFGHRLGEPVELLHRRTEGHVGRLDAALERALIGAGVH